MTHRKSSVSRKLGCYLVAFATIGAMPSLWAAEYVPARMDEAACEQGATSGKDFTGVTSSDWYFIGSKPPCAYAGSLKKYCSRIQTRQGYVFEEMAQALNDDPVWVNGMVAPFEGDDDAKAAALYSHPKQSLQKSLQKCGLNREQVRARLVLEAEAATKTDHDADLARDFGVIGFWAPDLAMNIWKRECAGHPYSDPSDHSESPRLDKYWQANPRYLQFCLLTTEDPMGKRPKDFSKIWTDISALSSE